MKQKLKNYSDHCFLNVRKQRLQITFYSIDMLNILGHNGFWTFNNLD